ncbi:uncharacterized protein [Paramisgurnus dabryanus]|uniref:uncharacterized protein n=1 Tax=Paramisgurnus dabryanus TaxID=90735 RepID=UPI0031F3A860
MERSRVTVLSYVLLLFSQTIIYGEEIEIKVRPGDNITLYCDRPLTNGYIVWIRNCSQEDHPSLIIDHNLMYKTTFPHLSFLQNSNNNSLDLHISNITVSDLGLYYCAEFKRVSGVQYRGNRTTRLSLDVTSCSGAFSSTVSPPPPVSDCFHHWVLLVSVCVVCFLLCFICVYCLCQKKTTGYESAKMFTVNVIKMDPTEKHQCEMSKTGRFCHHSEVTYRLLPSEHHYEKM